MLRRKALRSQANDSVVFFNFRPDRAREITRTFVDPDFNGFDAARTASSRCTYVCMTQYDATMPNVQVAFQAAEPEEHPGRVPLR